MDIIQCSLKFLIDSYTHLIRLEYDQSFILSWVLIEQYLNHEWNLYLDQRKFSKIEKRKYTGRDYTANMKINLLSLLGKLEEADNRELSHLRRTRNAFMHNIRLVQRKDAIEAFNLVLRFVKNRIDDYYVNLFQEFINEEGLK